MKKTTIAALLLLAPRFAFAASLDLFPIGHSFGANGAYQLGIDKGSLVGGCLQREVHDGQWLAGPCRDLLILAKDNVAVAHLGGAIMYNAEHGNASYDVRAGINLGPATQAFLGKIGQELPAVDTMLEKISSMKVPKFLAYIGQITTVDYAVGYRPIHDASVNGNLTHGPMVTMTIPLSDVEALLGIGL